MPIITLDKILRIIEIICSVLSSILKSYGMSPLDDDEQGHA